MRLIYSLVSLCGWIVVSFTATAQPLRVVVMVTDADGSPIAGAAVAVIRKSTPLDARLTSANTLLVGRTADDGLFDSAETRIPAGSYPIKVLADGYAPLQRTVSIEESSRAGMAILSFRLDREGEGEAPFLPVTNTRVRCATDISQDRVLKVERASRQRLARGIEEFRGGIVPVYAHVLAKSDGSGGVPVSQLISQISAMNTHYVGVGLLFYLAGHTETRKNEWYDINPGSSDPVVRAMKTTLHAGDGGSLNLYVVGHMNRDVLGFATFPWDLKDDAKSDGVVIAASTLPGGEKPYDLGITLVHEVGHWLGLYHTFQGSCDPELDKGGDQVNDTPPEEEPNFKCPSQPPDSCAALSGTDPIHNFMDYSPDSCLTEFSAGQVKRMKEQIALYRTTIPANAAPAGGGQ